jgi:predicted AAA+ superfamily ATPase
MTDWSSFLPQLGRLLDLAERVLERVAGAPDDPDLLAKQLALRWDAARERIVAVATPHLFDLADLVGVGPSVERLVRNTEQFVRGLPSNHVLLFRERGTGKSSAVKGLLARFGARGLRIVEVERGDLLHLPRILERLRDEPFRFLVFCDDLSFADGETGYRELKAALEGSLEAPAHNVRIVATSNRRHLLPQRIEDNRAVRLDDAGELHVGEALEEKLALSDRFGLVIGFYGFDQRTYLEIVDHYARRADLDLPRERLHSEALRFALDRSSRSGRTARQFVDDLAGRLGLVTGGESDPK